MGTTKRIVRRWEILWVVGPSFGGGEVVMGWICSIDELASISEVFGARKDMAVYL
jgi:hypothetical protein